LGTRLPTRSAMISVADVRRNHRLAALSDTVLQRWLPELEPIEIPLGDVLYESGEMVRYGYFPATAIVLLLYVMENGASAEITVVGNEGIAGILLVMDDGSTTSRPLLQSGGGFRMAAK
jgi:hypothetical protein